MAFDRHNDSNDANSPTSFQPNPRLPSFIYTKWFAYSGVATLILSLFVSWSLLSNPPTQTSPDVVVDLERDRENSESEADPEQWAVQILAESLIAEDMDPDLQPVNNVGREYFTLIDAF